MPQIFEKHNVRVLGTQIPVIMATEDRDVFGQKLREINEKLAQSICANTMEEALAAAEKVQVMSLLFLFARCWVCTFVRAFSVTREAQRRAPCFFGSHDDVDQGHGP